MKITGLIITALVLLIACQPKEEVKTQPSPDQSFEEYVDEFMEDWWEVHPLWAMYNGYYKHDSLLVVNSEESRKKSESFYQEKLEALRQFSVDSLNISNKVDHQILTNQLEGAIWNLKEFKSYQWDASEYNIGGSMAMIINGNYDTKEKRYESLLAKLKDVPAYYEAGKKNLLDPVLEHVQLAIQQNKGALSVIDSSLLDTISSLGWSSEKQELFANRLSDAQQAVRGFIQHLEQLEFEGNLENGKSFRIGKKLFNEKFEYDIVSGFTADEIYEDALKMKAELHAKMYDLSVELWSKHMKGEMPKDTLAVIQKVINQLSLVHVHRDSFIQEIRQQIPTLVEFIKEKDLIYIDPSKPLVVRETPSYMRGVAGASITSPGPYEPNANTYYNVTPLDHYSEEEAESYLREYNHYILQILNIHEAIPGHYTQLVYSNQSPSLVKSIFGNGAMIEGWAVYTERMMLEEGYGENAPEMWLMYYKWNLRTVCNTILDYSVHCKDFTKEQAMDLLVNQAFQQQAEAEGKWRRATLSQVQLCSYYTGFRDIYELRKEYQKANPEASVKQFHEAFLSFGSAPVKFIKPLLLGN